MRSRIVLILFAMLFLCSGLWAVNTIPRHGITWTFHRQLSADGAGNTYQTGTYANGDSWVIGDPCVIITAIDPCYIVKDSPMENGETWPDRISNSSVINPIPSNLQGYDSAAHGWKAEWCVNSSMPLTITVDGETPIKSLISVEKVTIVPTKYSRARLKAAAVLTIVTTTPAADAFRPHYAASSKCAEIQVEDIVWANLASLAPVASTPTIADSATKYERVRLVHKGTYPSSVIEPVDNHPGYGREVERQNGRAVLLLNLNYTQEQKQTLMYRFLQYGIDVYGIAMCREEAEPGHQYFGHRIWYGAGAIGIGKRTPLIFAAKMFNHAGMIAALTKQGDYLWDSVDADGYPNPYGPGYDNFPDDYIQFGEEQVFYVRQIHVDLTNNEAPAGWPAWNPDSRSDKFVAYTVDDKGDPEWGEQAARVPHTINKHWVISYRDVAGGCQIGSVLAFKIMDAETLCNHDSWFDYFDRYMAMIHDTDYSYVDKYDVTQYPFASNKPWRIGANGVDLYVTSTFIANMWFEYRNDYGPIWPAGASDETPPTPNPLTWSSVPAAVDSWSGTMTANTASDPCDPVQYSFTCTVGSGPDSGWQFATLYEPDTLTGKRDYTYTCKAKDGAGNEGTASSAESFTVEYGWDQTGIATNGTTGYIDLTTSTGYLNSLRGAELAFIMVIKPEVCEGSGYRFLSAEGGDDAGYPSLLDAAAANSIVFRWNSADGYIYMIRSDCTDNELHDIVIVIDGGAAKDSWMFTDGSNVVSDGTFGALDLADPCKITISAAADNHGNIGRADYGFFGLLDLSAVAGGIDASWAEQLSVAVHAANYDPDDIRQAIMTKGDITGVYWTLEEAVVGTAYNSSAVICRDITTGEHKTTGYWGDSTTSSAGNEGVLLQATPRYIIGTP